MHGQGLNGVATAVEFTFVPHGADFYDVSIINGFNIGIERLGQVLKAALEIDLMHVAHESTHGRGGRVDSCK